MGKLTQILIDTGDKHSIGVSAQGVFEETGQFGISVWDVGGGGRGEEGYAVG